MVQGEEEVLGEDQKATEAAHRVTSGEGAQAEVDGEVVAASEEGSLSDEEAAVLETKASAEVHRHAAEGHGVKMRIPDFARSRRRSGPTWSFRSRACRLACEAVEDHASPVEGDHQGMAVGVSDARARF